MSTLVGENLFEGGVVVRVMDGGNSCKSAPGLFLMSLNHSFHLRALLAIHKLLPAQTWGMGHRHGSFFLCRLRLN